MTYIDMQKNAFTAASATQNNLRKGEEVIPIARALYLQGLVEQLTLDVEKLKGAADERNLDYLYIVNI